MNLFLNLPTPVKAAIFVLSGGGLFAILHFGWPGPPVSYILFVAMALVAGSLVGYRFLLKRMDKGRSTPFLQKLRENSSAAPSAVNDPAARARLDDLRRKFEEGIATFKDHGKDIYSVPWYVLVGEPGSGKTEAVRHCNVGFPPGLQDQLQGAGGTLNMNWWFTNHAVILDTAGRLMFEEVVPGATNEWKEFLRLLRQVRPNCPINGMLLVIPADSLIKDSANEIEAKGGKIAEQLDSIQRALGVRFPVFVIISKSDLINGFREFFEDLTDPVLQHQMLGWSNPNPLDTPFKPEEVEKHLSTVSARLQRKRLGLMVDPAPKNDQSNTKLDEVDALYAFPDAIAKIGPRLRRYLEMVFVAGEWSQKPLFLRGIYFTSSMRQGEPLDADLAEALGVDVGKLPESGFLKPRDISYFLKDLFMDKVFRERGLVTRAANTKQVKRQRQLVGIGGGFLVILLALLFTVLGQGTLKRGILDSQGFWSAVRDEISVGSGESITLIYERGGVTEYAGGTQVELTSGGDKRTLSAVDLQVEARAQVDRPVNVPLIFMPMTLVLDNPFEKQTDAQRALFEVGVLQPAIERARGRLGSVGAAGWSPDATGALEQLVRLETAARAGSGSGLLSDGPPLRLDPLYAFVLKGVDDEGYEEFLKSHREALQRVLESTYAKLGSSWPPALAKAGTDDAGRAVNQGVSAFVDYWKTGADRPGTVLGDIVFVQTAAEGFLQAEEDLARRSGMAGTAGVQTGAQFNEALTAWSAAMARVRAAKADLDTGIERLNAQFDASGGRLPSNAELNRRARTSVLEQANGQYDALLAALPSADARGRDEDMALLRSLRERLEAGRAALADDVTARMGEIERTLASLRESVIDTPSSATTDQRGYQLRFAMYEAADRLLTAAAPTPELDQVGSEAERIGRLVDEARAAIRRSSDQGGAAAAFVTGREVSERAVRVAQRRLNRDLAEHAMRLMAQADMAQWVARRAEGMIPVSKPTVPGSRMTGGNFDNAFHPGAAAEVLAAYGAIRSIASNAGADASGDPSVLDAARLSQGLSEIAGRADRYLQAYARYWTEDVIREATFDVPPSWVDYQRGLNQLSVPRTMDALRSLSDAMQAALRAVPENLRVSTPGVAETLAALPADAAKLGDGRYRDDTNSCLRSFGDLPDTVRGAREVILGTVARDFEADYLLVFAPEAKAPGESYWSSVLLGGLRLLARNSLEEARVARDALVTESRGFPLCLDAPRTLTADEMTRALERVSLLVTGAPAGAARGDTIGDGAYGPVPDPVREELEKLRGQRVADRGTDRAWIERLGVVSGLFEGAEPLRWELVVLPLGVQTDQATASEYRYLQVQEGATPVTLEGRPRSQSDIGQARTQAMFEVPQRAVVRLAFSLQADTPFVAFARLPADWGGLAAMRAPGAAPLDPTRNAALSRDYADVWKLDVPLEDAEGNALSVNGSPVVYSLGVRFNRPMPSPDRWPTTATWPAN